MTNTPLPDTTKSTPRERWVLSSYRSLSPRGFLILMSALALISFAAGMAFLLMGAWPVFGFFGLDVLLVYIAFRLNYRDGRLYETVELDRGQLTLTRFHPSTGAQRFEFNSYWVRVLCSQGADGRTRLALTSHGSIFPFGGFLTDDERKEFAAVLADALQIARASRA
jgi:uncharacterized membrane protein